MIATVESIHDVVMNAAMTYYLEPHDCRARDGIVGCVHRQLCKDKDYALVTVSDDPRIIDMNEVHGTIRHVHRFYGENEEETRDFTFRIYNDKPGIGGVFSGPRVEVRPA